jgi:hypothetical protein
MILPPDATPSQPWPESGNDPPEHKEAGQLPIGLEYPSLVPNDNLAICDGPKKS